MASEAWTVGGVSVTSGAFKMLELQADPPAARTSWLSAADSEAAILMRKPLHENREIAMKLMVNPQVSMDTALTQIGTLIDKLSAASDSPTGTPVVWQPHNSTRSLTFTALNAEITGLPIGLSGVDYAWFQGRPVLTVKLDCKPYGAGTEVSAGTAAGTAPIVTKELTSILGDVPAEARLVVTDTASKLRRHAEWGLEGPLTYNASTSLMIDSDDMVTSGFSGAQATTSGAYDPNASGNNSVTATPVPGATTAICGTGNLSHIGVFRVKARIKVGSVSNQFRLSWRSGDGPMSSNSWVSASATDWVELDLGSIRIAPVVSGTQRWTGQVEVLGAASPGTVVIDYLVLMPQSSGYGIARAAYSIYSPGVVQAYDNFTGTTAAAALGTRAAPLGGSWATSGDATDFVFGDTFNFTDTTECIARATGVSETTGRFAILGTTAYTDTAVAVSIFYNGTLSGDFEQAVVARWVDSSNYLRLVMPMGAAFVASPPRLEQVVAGVATTLSTAAAALPVSTTYRLALLAYASGGVIGLVMTSDGRILQLLTASSTAVATGGALASGKPGIRDRSTSAVSSPSRPYTAFTASAPAPELVVLYSGRTMQVTSSDAIRDDSTGTYTGRVPAYNGSRFMVPPGTSRVAVKARRNDVAADGAVDDQVTDLTKFEVFYTPRYLVIPRA